MRIISTEYLETLKVEFHITKEQAEQFALALDNVCSGAAKSYQGCALLEEVELCEKIVEFFNELAYNQC